MDYLGIDTQADASPEKYMPPFAQTPAVSGRQLKRRFASQPTPLSQEPLVYEFTDDKALLHQYYRLRVQMYRKAFGAIDFDEREDKFDKISHIIIARRGKLCVGGCRLTVCEAGEELMLPMESADFKLKTIFPEMELSKQIYGEVSRFAVAEDNPPHVLVTLVTLLMEKGASLLVDYTFARAEALVARSNRKIVNNSNLYTGEIHTGLDVPTIIGHPEIKMYLNVFTRIKTTLSSVPHRLYTVESAS